MWRDERLRTARAQVMQAFFDRGGVLIDSRRVWLLRRDRLRLQHTKGQLFFPASKVWTVLKPLDVSRMGVAQGSGASSAST
jgi:hypothetical protein